VETASRFSSYLILLALFVIGINKSYSEPSCTQAPIRRITRNIADPYFGQKKSLLSSAEIIPQKSAETIPASELSSNSLQWIETTAAELRTRAHRLADQYDDTVKLEAYYVSIKNQLPKNGEMRALSEAEVKHIFRNKGLEVGKYFSRRNESARVGHGQNFIFIRCKQCPESWFQEGSTGGGVVNTKFIPLENLEVIVPQVPLD
jgi:hypothetical protein